MYDALVSPQVLVLNASYEPINVIPLRRAMDLTLQEKVETLDVDEGATVRSAYRTWPKPTVLRLIKYAPVPRHRKAYLNRRGILMRDNHICAYCGERATTMDHVIPRSKGGRHSWENVVACCFKCNQKKDDHLLSEMGWALKFRPYTPEGSRRIIMLASHVHPTWEKWLPEDLILK